MKVVNVNAHSLGLVTRSRSSSDQLYTSILIPRNTPLPHSASQVFRTGRTGQRRILIRIVEGDAPDPAACIQLGEFFIEPLPRGLPAGSPDSTPLHVRPERTDQGPGGCRPRQPCGRRSRSAGEARRPASGSRTGPCTC